MRTLIVGGRSSLARALRPKLAGFSEVLTAGRTGCDLVLDLASGNAELDLPAGIDVVINTACHFGGKSGDAIRQAVAVNVRAPLALSDACLRASVKQFVHVSSIFALLDSSSPFFGVYALTKRQGDELLQLHCAAAGLPLAIVRPSQFYGAGAATRRHQPFFTALIDKAERGENIELFGSHDARRNFIHVDDVAEAVCGVVEQRVTGVYACQYPTDIGYAEIAREAIRSFGSASMVRFRPDKPNALDNTLPIDGAVFERIGFRPRISMAQGMVKEAHLRKGGA